MTKKIGRNDPCPCGSGKKYKKCCEERLGPKRNFQASVISSGISSGKGLEGKATKISTDFFSKPQAPKEEPRKPRVSKEEPRKPTASKEEPRKPRVSKEKPRKPDDDKPHHPPEADKPM